MGARRGGHASTAASVRTWGQRAGGSACTGGKGAEKLFVGHGGKQVGNESQGRVFGVWDPSLSRSHSAEGNRAGALPTYTSSSQLRGFSMR